MANDRPSFMAVVSPEEVNQAEAAATLAKNSENNTENELFAGELARYIRNRFQDARDQRQTELIERYLLNELRTYKGEYDPTKLAEIAEFQGSQVFARISSVKCRGATAVLKDLYLNEDLPWAIAPTPDPEVPEEIGGAIDELISTEVGTLAEGGQTIDPQVIADRKTQLEKAAKQAEGKQAVKAAEEATNYLNDILTEGGFYQAFAEFLIDLPIFLIGCIKGPVIRKETEIKWKRDGTMVPVTKAKMFWERVSPFDMYFSPGASDPAKSTIMERVRWTRAELTDLKDLPGVNSHAIDDILGQMNTKSQTLSEWLSYFESERAWLERREDPNEDREGMFVDGIEYNGYLRGEWLLDWGIQRKQVKDKDKEYYCQAWLINNTVIRAQVAPNPRKRPTYYVTSFEKIPGSVYGNGLIEILSDVQDVANATLRALVNNLGIASGPQVMVDDDRMAPSADTDSLYPWKRWHTISDPLSNNQAAVQFFQPESNSQELMSVYKEFSNMADEISALPKYLTGSQRTGGAAATASGLSMLMSNASKMMQSVAGNIDKDVLDPMLTHLYDMVMLTEPGKFRGDENIVVKGVNRSIKQEQDRVRQLEFLQMTANPIDMQIMGADGRAKVLHETARNIGLEYDNPVPNEDEMAAKQQAAEAAAAAQGAPGGQPGPGAEGESATPRMDIVSQGANIS